MTRTIRVGILGTGFMAVAHMKALAQLSDVRVVALCNPSGRNLDGDFSKIAGNVGNAQPFRLAMDGVRTYRDVVEFLRDRELDVIDITTPTSTHAEYGFRAIEAGYHVMIEKPFARNRAEAANLVAAAERAKARGRWVMPAMALRFWPEWAWLRKVILERRFGKVLSARFRRVAQPPAWGQAHFMKGTSSGGALLDLHVHDVDFIRACFGECQSVLARGHTMVSGEIDHVVALYEVTGGAVVSAEGSWCMADGFGFNMAYTVNFERATVDYDLARGKDALKCYPLSHGAPDLTEFAADGYVGEWRYFLDCIRAEKTPVQVTVHDGQRSIEICEAAGRSVRSGRWESTFGSGG